MSHVAYGARLARSVGLVALAAGCRGGGKDLTEAIDAGVGRRIVTPSVQNESLVWRQLSVARNDSTLPVTSARSMCWLGDSLLVATSNYVYLYDGHGNYQRQWLDTTTVASRARQFESIRCSADTSVVLLADQETRRVMFFNRRGGRLFTLPAPKPPQDVPYLGEYALGHGATWFESWLGARVGPYLVGSQWDTIPLAHVRRDSASIATGIGRTWAYRNPVLRRVFNRVSMTVWQRNVFSSPSSTVGWNLSSKQGSAVPRMGGGVTE